MAKRKEDSEMAASSPPKKNKSSPKQPQTKRSFEKKSKPSVFNKKKTPLPEKPENWNDFKKQKKELRLKRRQNKSGFDVVVQAKKIGEKLRCKTLKGGEEERNKLINQLHSLLKDQGHYAKFVLAHDTSRIIQWLLKYSSDLVKEQIAKELLPVTLDMFQSKYGIFCIKRLMKYGKASTKSAIIDKIYGNAVKLASHVISASIFDEAYTSHASPLQKSHLLQEFFSDMYKNSKDDNVKHLRDVYKCSPDLKAATLGATRANLGRILNKNLLDSSLVQSVLCQYLSECNREGSDRAELITQLVSHIVVISNSKDGSRAAMQCIWHGSNKDRKVAMKTIKEHAVAMAKHEHAHCTLIALLDTADDTVLLNKIVVAELLKGAAELAAHEWGRRVLLWLVAAGDSACFHRVFVEELERGRKSSTAKKAAELRRKEVLAFVIEPLLGLIKEGPEFWMENSSRAYVMLAIVKAATGRDELSGALEGVTTVIGNPGWNVEDAGLHMIVKKLAQLNGGQFGEILVGKLNEKTVAEWLKLNRGCFLIVAVYENGSNDVREILRKLLKVNLQVLETQQTAGSKILLKKLKEDQ